MTEFRAAVLACSPGPTNPNPVVKVLEPGLVLIRKAFDLEQQLFLAKSAITRGVEQRGFFEAEVDSLNSTPTRGRIYDSLESYRDCDRLREMCHENLELARSHDPAVPMMYPTHLLLLMYSSERGMGFHRDNGANDGTGEFPVVSFCVGNSCDFALKHEKRDTPHEIRLDSGDVIIFGGPCRMILHSVVKVHQRTAPSAIAAVVGDNRINYTFRYAPGVLGREQDFAEFKPARRNEAMRRQLVSQPQAQRPN